MRRLIYFSCFAVILLVTILALSSPFAAQVNQYSKEGLSFNYPSDWPAQEEINEQVVMVSLDRGQNEAKIMVMAFRETMIPEQINQAQANVTQALVDTFTQSIQQQGAQVERSFASAMVAGRQASGVRLRAVIKGDPGNAEIYWLTLNNRLIYLVFVGSDTERARASVAWNMLCSTLRIGGTPSGPPRQSATPSDLGSFNYRRITGNRVELYMDEWGRGYVHDLNNGTWVRIPDYSGKPSHHRAAQNIIIQIHPSFSKTSDTMALMYAFGGLLVYDSSLYTAQNPASAWVLNYQVSQRGQAFASITRTRVINHISQVNDSLALAAGTNWICVYDISLHKWVNYQACADDSTAELNRNLVLASNGARVKVLNGPFCNYTLGVGSWRCEGISLNNSEQWKPSGSQLMALVPISWE
ncbi:MAG TPA: hypothetical protein VJS44_12780 [Pyrinomonadaceae bacterium]|nr:hypothetical protein [Pyrinomonadaceae bacterium]